MYEGWGIIQQRTVSIATVEVHVAIIFFVLFYFELFRLTIQDTKKEDLRAELMPLE